MENITVDNTEDVVRFNKGFRRLGILITMAFWGGCLIPFFLLFGGSALISWTLLCVLMAAYGYSVSMFFQRRYSVRFVLGPDGVHYVNVKNREYFCSWKDVRWDNRAKRKYGIKVYSFRVNRKWRPCLVNKNAHLAIQDALKRYGDGGV